MNSIEQSNRIFQESILRGTWMNIASYNRFLNHSILDDCIINDMNRDSGKSRISHIVYHQYLNNQQPSLRGNSFEGSTTTPTSKIDISIMSERGMLSSMYAEHPSQVG